MGEYETQQGHSAQIAQGDADVDDAPKDQVYAAQKQSDGGNLTDTAAHITHQQIHKSIVIRRGKISGLLTVFMRYFGGSAEGVSYAILLMNICVPIIEKVTRPGRFGVSREDRKAAKAAKKGGDKA